MFFTLLFLFIRFLPLISISEVRELVAEEREGRSMNGSSPALRIDGGVSRTGGIASRPRSALTQAGYRAMDAYTPFPVEGLAEALGRKGTAMPLIVLIGGISAAWAAISCNGTRW